MRLRSAPPGSALGLGVGAPAADTIRMISRPGRTTTSRITDGSNVPVRPRPGCLVARPASSGRKVYGCSLSERGTYGRGGWRAACGITSGRGRAVRRSVSMPSRVGAPISCRRSSADRRFSGFCSGPASEFQDLPSETGMGEGALSAP